MVIMKLTTLLIFVILFCDGPLTRAQAGRDAAAGTTGDRVWGDRRKLQQCVAAEGTTDLVNLIIRVGEERDGLPVLFIPVVDEGMEGIAFNQPMDNDYFPFESFEWFATTLPDTFDEGNAGIFDGLPPNAQAQLPPFYHEHGIAAEEWGYKKWPAIDPWWLLFIGMDPHSTWSKDHRNTIFSKNLEHRDNDNLMKKQYFSALSCDKLPLYQAKINRTVNAMLNETLSGEVGVLGSWSKHTLDLFIDLHFEGLDHPSFVREYVDAFVELQAPGSTEHVRDNRELLEIGSCLSGDIRDYIEERRLLVSEPGAELKENFLYHWNAAGLDPDAIVGEIVHNILAWGQHVNILFLVLRLKLGGMFTIQNVYDGPIKSDETLDFIELLHDAPGYGERLDVAREAFRMLTPVDGFMSSFIDSNFIDDSAPLDYERANLKVSNHSTAYIQAMNDNFRPGDRNMESNTDFHLFHTDRYDGFKPQRCPFAYTDNSTDMDPEEFFTTTEDGTVVPIFQEDHFPVFEAADPNSNPINGMKYCPFGAGYRRCPSELFNLNLLQSVMDGLAGLEFEVRDGYTVDDLFDTIDLTIPDHEFNDAVPMGKRRARDNIYVVQN